MNQTCLSILCARNLQLRLRWLQHLILPSHIFLLDLFFSDPPPALQREACFWTCISWICKKQWSLSPKLRMIRSWCYLGSEFSTEAQSHPALAVPNESWVPFEGNLVISCRFKGMEEVLVSETIVMEFSVESSALSTLAFKKGGCFGEGISNSLSVSIWTTSVMDGLSEAEACVHRSPIWSTFSASFPGFLSLRRGSMAWASVFAL